MHVVRVRKSWKTLLKDIIMKLSGHYRMVKMEAKFENGYI